MGNIFRVKNAEQDGGEAYGDGRYPFYIKAPIILIGLYLLFYVAWLLQDVIIPFAFAGLLAILLNPIFTFFLNRKINKIVSIVLTILLAILVVAAVMGFLSSQIVQFGQMLPQLEQKTLSLVHDLQSWLTTQFGISTEKQMSMA